MKLTKEQEAVFDQIKEFIREGLPYQIFILKGYAGTGKTTLVRFLLKWMSELKKFEPVLLASTGRAAKVLQSKSGHPAFTVHSHIYSFEVLEESGTTSDGKKGQLSLNFSLKSPTYKTPQTIYIVDEASMLSHLSNNQNTFTRFGSGSLLRDLFEFVGSNKIIFVGDPAQLPPVKGENAFSPALSAAFLEKDLKKAAKEVELTEILRQRKGHPILSLATRLREIINTRRYPDWTIEMEFSGTSIYRHFGQARMITKYLEVVGEEWDQAIILTHSNKQAYYLNKNIRKRIFDNRPPHHLQKGELLMVAQNSYYVPLANGDQVVVRKIKPAGKKAGFFFLDVEVESIHNSENHKTLLLHDFLFQPDANLDPERQRALLIDFDKRICAKGIVRNSKEYKEAMVSDPYLNALRTKFGYAVTCHKSQGGEWPHVFINLSNTLNFLPPEERFRWLYTAVTRAQKSLNLKPIYQGKNRW